MFHPSKGRLTKTVRYNPLTNKKEVLGVDEKGKSHKLDGSEIPFSQHEENLKKEKHQKMTEELEAKFSEMDSEVQQDELMSDQEKEQNEKQACKEEEARKHTQVLDKVQEASQVISDAIKDIPETVIPDHLEEQRKWKEEIIEALKIEIPEFDDERIIKAIEAIKFPEIKIPEPKDYSELLKSIKEALPENTDLTGVIQAIEARKNFEIPEKLISNNRIKVEVDRIAMPNGGAANLDTSLLATEETLQALTSNYKKISEASDNVTTVNYTDTSKSAVSTIVQTSASLGLSATETFDNSGATTLIITRS